MKNSTRESENSAFHLVVYVGHLLLMPTDQSGAINKRWCCFIRILIGELVWPTCPGLTMEVKTKNANKGVQASR